MSMMGHSKLHSNNHHNSPILFNKLVIMIKFSSFFQHPPSQITKHLPTIKTNTNQNLACLDKREK